MKLRVTFPLSLAAAASVLICTILALPSAHAAPMTPTLGTPPVVPNVWRLEVFDPSNIFGQGGKFGITSESGELIAQEVSLKKVNFAFLGANGLWELTAEANAPAVQPRIRQGQYYGSNIGIASNSTTTLSAPGITEGVRFGFWNMARQNIPGCTLTPSSVNVRSWDVGNPQFFDTPEQAIGKISLAVLSKCQENPRREATIFFWSNVAFEQESLLDIRNYKITSYTEQPSYPVKNLLIGRPWMSGSVGNGPRLPSLESIDLSFFEGAQSVRKRISRVQLQVPNGTYVSDNILATVFDGTKGVDGVSWTPYQPPGSGRSASIPLNLETLATGYGNRLNIALMFPPVSRVFALSYLKVYTKPRFFNWQNQRNACDVNDDGFVTPMDLLILNSAPPRQGSLPLTRTFSEPLLDVNGDGAFSPIDLLTMQACLH